MKKIAKKIFYIHLFILIKLIFLIKKPFVVIIVWTDNKSFLKAKLKKSGIEKGLNLNKNNKVYNTRFGVALNILDLPSWYSNNFKWVWIYALSLFKFWQKLFFLPKHLFLEAGIDSSWEAAKFLNLLSPQIVVFGSINHNLRDDFEYLDIIEKEYSKIIDYLNDWAKDNPIMEESWSFDDLIDFVIKWEKNIWVINPEYPKLEKLWWKLIKKFYLDSSEWNKKFTDIE